MRKQTKKRSRKKKKNCYPVAIRNTRSPLCRKQTGRNSCSVSSKLRTGDNNGNEIWRIPMKALYLNTSNQSVGNTWSPENRGAYYPTYSNKNEINDYNYQASSWSVEDGSYIRLKNVTLGYNVPSAFLAKTKAISSCRIYVAGADLWEYSKINDGWDPEASRKVSAAGRFPFVRTVTFGLNLTF